MQAIRALTATVVLTGLLTAAPAEAATSSPVTVTSLSGASGPLAGGQRISVHGNGFAHISKVLFGRAAGRSVRVTSTHLLSVVVPKHEAGRVDVRVVTSSGQSPAVKGDRFTFVAPPVLTKVSFVGTRVTVKGRGFSHVKAVLFGKSNGSNIHVSSSTSLLVTAPAHSPGVVDVRVRTAYGTSKAVQADHFSYGATTVATPIAPTPTPAPTTTPAPAQPLAITTSSLPDYRVGNTYGGTLTASGGSLPYHWSATGLPLGLTVSAAGELGGGSYASAGLRHVILTVVDATGVSATKPLTILVHAYAGLLRAWGYGGFGQMGDAVVAANGHPPVTVPSPVLAKVNSVISVVGNDRDGFAARSDGTVWGFGDNEYQQITTDSQTSGYLTPQQEPGLTNVVSLAAGSATTYALTTDGTVFAWGIGASGQIGNGLSSLYSAPVQVSNLTHIVSIAATQSSAAAVRDDGTVLTWGSNTQGELGDPGAGATRSSPAAVPGLTDVVSVAGMSNTLLALHADGTVSSWGYNMQGELGTGSQVTFSATPAVIPGLSHVVQIAGGSGSGFALLADGTLRAWGANSAGQLGDGTRMQQSMPVSIDLDNVQAVYANELDAFVILGDGTAKIWGADVFGSIGDGNTSPDRITPITVTWMSGIFAFGQGSNSRSGYAITRMKLLPVNPIPVPPPVQ